MIISSLSSDHSQNAFASNDRYVKQNTRYENPPLFPRRRIPAGVSDHLSGMSIQTHRSHQHEVRDIDNAKHHHRLPRRELRSHLFGKVEREDQGDDSGEEEPLGHRVSEEQQADQLRWVSWPVGDDEAQE